MAEVKWKKVENELNMWLPENIGDELIGVVLEKKAGLYGDQFLIKQKDDAEVWTPSHKVLQNRMNSVGVGQVVKIVFDGVEPAKQRGFNPTSIYSVYITE